MPRRDIVVIGASNGGIGALMRLMEALPADLPAAVFVVIHYPESGPRFLAQMLARKSRLPVQYAEDGEPIRSGNVFLAPPGHHLLLRRDSMQLTRGARENRHRPAIDPLFRSAAVAFGPRVIAAVLTGDLDDGTVGASAVKRCGGVVVVQDPADAHSPEMPQSVLRNVTVDHSVPLEKLATVLRQLVAEEIDAAPAQPPALVAAEVQMTASRSDEETLLDRVGRRSTLTCPECDGTLWELNDQVLHFRCHVGHAFAPETLMSAHTRRLEDALWAAIRGFGESVRISEVAARRFRDSSQEDVAQRFAKRAEAARKHAEALRQLIDAMPVAWPEYEDAG